eukprot:1943876-Rhodomonas_salina.2
MPCSSKAFLSIGHRIVCPRLFSYRTWHRAGNGCYQTRVVLGPNLPGPMLDPHTALSTERILRTTTIPAVPAPYATSVRDIAQQACRLIPPHAISVPGIAPPRQYWTSHRKRVGPLAKTLPGIPSHLILGPHHAISVPDTAQHARRLITAYAMSVPACT